MKEINVVPTATVITDIANTMRVFANNLDRVATSMVERGDLTYAAEAMQEVKNCYANLRTDLLITLPLRELGK